MMTKQLFSRGLAWWICPVIGHLSAGCSDKPDNRLDDRPMTCTPDTRIYRMTAVDPSVRVANRIDLDGDSVADDQLGRGHDMLSGIEPAFAIKPRIGKRLATDVPWLVALDRCGDEVRITIDQGIRIDDNPGHVLMPTVLPRAVGNLKDNVLFARDGTARLPLVALADALDTALAPGWTEADGLIVTASEHDDTLDGVVAAALDTEVARKQLAPPIAAFLTAQGPDDILKHGADADHDGTVTADELAATDAYREIVSGDVVVGGSRRTSIALAFTAVRIR
jgi:hypothetical protein